MLEGEIRPPRLGEVLDRQPPEGYSEIGAVEGVDEGIDGRVEPAQPRQVVHDERVHLGAGDEGREEVADEEGQPAGDEAAHDDAERLGRLGLAAEGGDARRGLEVEGGRRVEVERLGPGPLRGERRRPVQASGALRRQGLVVEGVGRPDGPGAHGFALLVVGLIEGLGGLTAGKNYICS